MYSIGKFRKYLDTPASKMINFCIAPSLDYCSLLYGKDGNLISQLQLCQHNVVRMRSLRRKFDHIRLVLCGRICDVATALKVLHWLLVRQIIEYKVLLLTHKALYGKAPAYLSQLLSLYIYIKEATATRNQKSPHSSKMPFGSVWQTLFLVCCSVALEISTYIC